MARWGDPTVLAVALVPQACAATSFVAGQGLVVDGGLTAVL